MVTLLGNLANWFSHPAHILGMYLMFQAAVENLPEPGTNPFYRFVYGFAHTIAIRLNQKQAGLAAPKVLVEKVEETK
jgi:hypothetical protein